LNAEHRVLPQKSGHGPMIWRWAPRRVPGRARSFVSLLLCDLLLLVLLPAVTGCRTVQFYAQAIHGQCQILHRQESITTILARTNTPPELAGRLRQVLAIRAFAERELKLPANGHYVTYADLGRRFAVWNVYAAPEFSLEAKAWWYPIVGRLKYRGYFDEKSARRLADELRAHGHDVHVGGVQAYSTLGWFHDPVLNTFVFDDDADLAELLIHELAHQRVFASGDTDFNEAFATTVAEEGVRRWLRATRPEALEEYERETRRKYELVSLITETRTRLQAAYTNHPSAVLAGNAERNPDSNPNLNPERERLRGSKTAIFAAFRRDYVALRKSWGLGDSDETDSWLSAPLNNARLNTVETYYRLVPNFRRLLARCEGDLDRFFAQSKRLAALRKERRDEELLHLKTEAPRTNAANVQAPGPGR
jgi:predicted aminopeptidase